MITGGVASAADSATALEAALLEMAQSRVSIISGAREDFANHIWTRRSGTSFAQSIRNAESWMEGWERVDFERSLARPTKSTLDSLLSSLHDAGLGDVIAVRLTELSSPVTVFRAIVPGLEVAGDDSFRVGQRLLQAWKQGADNVRK